MLSKYIGPNLVCGWWKVEYPDREKRYAAYERLVIKLKELEPDATRESVVKKINNLRSNVRKEKKKRDISMKSGASTDNVYTSKLWYLDIIDITRELSSLIAAAR